MPLRWGALGRNRHFCHGHSVVMMAEWTGGTRLAKTRGWISGIAAAAWGTGLESKLMKSAGCDPHV